MITSTVWLMAAWLAGAGLGPGTGAAAPVVPARAQTADRGDRSGRAASDRPAQPASRPAAKPDARQPGRPRSFEAAAAVVALGSTSLGSSAARLTAADGTPGGFTLFTASADLGAAPGLEGRVGYNLTRTIAVEATLLYVRPSVNFGISGDAEGAAGFTATGEKLTELVAEASLVVYLPGLTFAGGRGRLFADAGAGYLRQLHGQASATSGFYASDTGRVGHVGGGVRYWFRTRPAGPIAAWGLRVDGRLYVASGGFSFDGRAARTPAVSASAIVAF